MNYNKLSTEYDQLYLKNLKDFQNNSSEKNNSRYVDFYPSFGTRRREHVDFLIYGQAVKGWGTGFSLKDTLNAEKVEKSVNESNDYPAECHTPLDWVNVLWSDTTLNEYRNDQSMYAYYNNDYRACRSFFWNVVYKLINDYYKLGRNSKDWSKELVWSNLYKIAPEDRSNPSEEDKYNQLSMSIQLVRKEIEEIKPRYCIVLTNMNWWEPFSKELKPQILDYEKPASEIVEYSLYNHTKIIVTTRALVGDSEKHVAQILKLLH